MQQRDLTKLDFAPIPTDFKENYSRMRNEFMKEVLAKTQPAGMINKFIYKLAKQPFYIG